MKARRMPLGGSGLSSRDDFSKSSSSCVAPDPVAAMPADPGLTRLRKRSWPDVMRFAGADRGVTAGAGPDAAKRRKPEDDRLRSINKVNAVTVKIRGWRVAVFTFGS
jgi:hypothetical protein